MSPWLRTASTLEAVESANDADVRLWKFEYWWDVVDVCPLPLTVKQLQREGTVEGRDNLGDWKKWLPLLNVIGKGHMKPAVANMFGIIVIWLVFTLTMWTISWGYLWGILIHSKISWALSIVVIFHCVLLMYSSWCNEGFLPIVSSNIEYTRDTQIRCPLSISIDLQLYLNVLIGISFLSEKRIWTGPCNKSFHLFGDYYKILFTPKA